MRQVLSLDSGWLFHLGDVDPPLPNTHLAAYMLNKAGYSRGAAKPQWDDSDWRGVDLPHDWSVEGEFSPDNHVDAGFLPRGVAWYRRHFALDDSDRGKHLSITFDGVDTHCAVYINGHLLHRNFCGYTPFTIDITDVARFGEDEVNTIAVRVDATYAEGWWYEGTGIYRHVWLTKTHPLHIANDGVFVTSDVTDASATLTIRTRIRNTSAAPVTFQLTSSLHAGVERSAAERHPGSVDPHAEIELTQRLEIPSPRLWSCDDPHLYSLRSTLEVDGATVDEVTTPFGIRTIRFDSDHGFFLNDQPLKLKGTCNHQDHAGVGVALPDSLHEFRIRLLKEMGCNAYRCAHHPPARELLDACDRLGMLVIDENRNFGSSPEHLDQLRAMILRDRNHPSVIAWSICNEEAIQGTPVAANIARAMTAEVKKLDPTRPVMAAVSGGILNDDGLAAAMEDLVGINYQLPVNDQFHAKYPRVPVVAAETHCVLSTRGTYATDAAKHVFASYDADTAPWGATARETWRFVSQRPYLAGLFAWTGFDYRGEPTPHAWPCMSSQFGMMDLCGFEKDAFLLHKAFFTRGDEPFVHVLPHWNWPGREGEPIRVMVYSNCDTAELFLNGDSLGRRTIDPIEMGEWQVPYRPGALRAVGYRGDTNAADAIVETTGPAAALGLEIHPSAGVDVVRADGELALPVTVFALDAAGRRVPDADDHVSFALTGPAKIIGVGNGDPASHEPNKSSARKLFRGLAQVIVQTATTPGTIVLTASASGLAAASLKLESVAASGRSRVPPARRRHFLTDWRMSPITATRPDPRQEALAQDMNTWQRVEPGKPQPQWAHAGDGGYAIYRTSVTLPKAMQAGGGRIVFREIAGAADIFVAGPLVASKSDPSPAPVEAPIPASATRLEVSVVLSANGAVAGLLGRVELAAP